MVESPDTFDYASRATLLEQLGRLAGAASRPMGSVGGGIPFSARQLTTENALAMALAMGRRGCKPDCRLKHAHQIDIGPEMAYAIGSGVPDRRHDVEWWLAKELLNKGGHKATKASNWLPLLAGHAYEQVAFGQTRMLAPRGRHRPLAWDALVSIGIMWLWVAAERTVARAEYVLHAPDAGADESLHQRKKRWSP